MMRKKMIVCDAEEKIKKLVTSRKEKKNFCFEVVVFYSLRSPLRFLSFLARASLSASNRVLLRASHSSVLVANLV